MDGRKNAIAETVAMMNKMKLEEQMRIEAAKGERAGEASRPDQAGEVSRPDQACEVKRPQPLPEGKDQNGNQRVKG